ncbi:MAG: IS1634 family transposase [Acidimicrobiales bacterium]
MYLRTIQRRNKDGSTVRYCQLAHNVRNQSGQSQAEVVYSFGREGQLDREALSRLVRSISRFLEPDQALVASASSELRFLGSRPYGGAYVLDHLWRRLGIDEALQNCAGARRLDPAVERVLFSLVANRCLAPSSKRAALEWASFDVAIPDMVELGADPQVFYRAMDFLLEVDEQLQREVFFSVAKLLNLEVDVILFDTTSTYFESEVDDDFRRFGHSKDSRPDRPQVVIGLAVTKEGIPVRVWSFAGNASDTLVIRQVHDELGDWKLHRVLWVGDRGFSSSENRTYLQRGGHFLFGEKLRSGKDNTEALARAERYQQVGDHLEVKEVWLSPEGTARRRFVICRNLAEATRDQSRRESALERVAHELEAIEAKRGDARLAGEGELLAHPTLARYLTRRGRSLVIDKKKVAAEARLDGKFLLSSSDDSLSASDMARLYKGLLEVEDSWREMKQTLELRPVHHRKEERIRAHVTLCFLGLMLIRVAERATDDTWRNLRRELDRMHLGTFAGPAGSITQRTKTTARQREILHDLDIKGPPVVLALQTPHPRRQKKSA